MRKWLLAAIAVLLFAAGAYAKDKVIKYGGNLLSLPTWTASTRYGTSPGTVGFNTVNNLPEWLDNNATWHSFAPTDAPVFTGIITAATLNVTGTTTANVLKATTTFQQTTAYSAAGTPLPTCNAAAKGTRAWVSDATTPAYLTAYTSGGAVVSPVFCDGTNWLTD